MYRYVEDKEFLRRAQNCCSDLMHELEDELRENGINSQFFLVGSGARNMVTQNGDEAIDFDYNLNIISCADFHDCKAIKHEVLMAFNRVMRRNNLADVDDSTSTKTNAFCLGIILCNVSRSFDYLIYPYYPAYTS